MRLVADCGLPPTRADAEPRATTRQQLYTEMTARDRVSIVGLEVPVASGAGELGGGLAVVGAGPPTMSAGGWRRKATNPPTVCLSRATSSADLLAFLRDRLP